MAKARGCGPRQCRFESDLSLQPTRRGFLGTILAIPLAGYTGFRAVMAPKPLYFPPIVPGRVQQHMNNLMNSHMENVKLAISRDFSMKFERKLLGLEDLDGVHETPKGDFEPADGQG